MKLQIRTFFLAMLLATTPFTYAQKSNPVNFDKISLNDFSLNGVNVDTSYGAVVLSEVGNSSFIANKKGYFSLVYKYQRRVKILHSKAFDIATVKIPLYKNAKTDDEETLESLKATTYNVENGKIVETDLEKSNVYREVADKNLVIRKFTMPAIREGSVIDVSYTIQSDFLFNLQPWSFQGSYPILWSEYNLNLPSFFEYVFLRTGTRDFDVKESKEKYQNYLVRVAAENMAFGRDEMYSLNSTNTISRWVMKNVPALKEEPFTSSIKNHLSRIEFQLSGRQFPNAEHVDILGSWSKAALELSRDENFAGKFQEENNWAADALQKLNVGALEPLEKARVIYSFVQRTVSNKGIRDIYLSKPLKETLSSKAGYVADINLLLTLLLKKAGLQAFPVLLSTRSHGYATEQFPILNQYNYVITKLKANNQNFYLDASDNKLGFGKLPIYCYNGTGALIDLGAGIVPLNSSDLLEKKTTRVILVNNAQNKDEWVGSLQSALGYYESLDIRKDIAEKGQTAYEKTLSDAYTNEYSIRDIKMDDVDKLDKEIKMNYALKITRSPENDIIYFNPMLKEGMKENYFKSEERKYPVELYSKIDETYNFTIQVPEGFVVDETPKSTRVSLNETDGSFEYIIAKSPTEVSLTTSLKINKAIFLDDEYEALRGFLDFVVKKHAEQIVFKKKP